MTIISYISHSKNENYSLLRILGIIPARYHSSRFPGKPLVEIAGKTMIHRVYDQCRKATKLTDIVVATDDERIASHVTHSIQGNVVMTSPDHLSGTERVAEAYRQQLESGVADYDYVVNIQGDEPLIKPELIDDLCDLLNYKTEIATAAKRIEDVATLFDPNVVKVVLTMRKMALYFSRQAIPFVREAPTDLWLEHAEFFKHIGIYAFRTDVLDQIVKLPENVLENTEKLEQLRWLGYGYKIIVKETEHDSVGIDTPEDIKKLII